LTSPLIRAITINQNLDLNKAQPPHRIHPCAPRQVGRNVEELEDVRLIVHRGELYLQFVGSMRTFNRNGEPERNLEGRQWLGRLERFPQVRMLAALQRSMLTTD